MEGRGGPRSFFEGLIVAAALLTFGAAMQPALVSYIRTSADGSPLGETRPSQRCPGCGVRVYSCDGLHYRCLRCGHEMRLRPPR